MIFVTGPMFSGKRTCICTLLGWTDTDLEQRAAVEVQELAGSGTPLDELAAKLSGYEVVTASETGCGIVPIQREDRDKREAAGRLSCLLAKEADTVIRVCCGIPQLLKGEWPCRSN